MLFHELCADDASITTPDVLQCFFGLRDLEIELYCWLLVRGECRTEDLAEGVSRDGSVISRALKRLDTAGLLLTRKCGRDGGGYFKCYEAVPADAVASMMRQKLDHFVEKIENSLDSWEPRLEEAAAHLIQ